MPFINTKTTVEITADKEVSIKKKLGTAIADLEKSESWLMLNFEDKSRMYFKGKNDKPLAIAEISLFGKATGSQYDTMTNDVTKILSEELAIDKENIYVKYEEVDHWGYNGFNF